MVLASVRRDGSHTRHCRHRERGAAVGADAYVLKSQFDQGQLLDTVSRLL